jgi:hypothetical protein
VILGAPQNALAESESALLSSRGPGTIRKYLEALVRLTGESGRFVCGSGPDFHFADVGQFHSRTY